MIRKLVGMLVASLLMAGTASVARAADEDPDAWHVTITPYVWATGLYGDVTVRGRSVELDDELPRHPRANGHPGRARRGAWR